MPDTRDPRSVVEVAEQAAAAGDYASAERLLREAASLQEATLGPHHPDLANTLNNLAVVCEITNKPDDAEQCYRRAVEIASAVLDADHPFLATSRKNLEEFRAARGQAVDPPAPPQAVEAERDPIAARRDEPPIVADDLRLGFSEKRPAGGDGPLPLRFPEQSAAVVDEPRPRWGTIGMLLVAGSIALVVVAILWLRSSDAPAPESPSASAPAEKPAPTTPPAQPSAEPSKPAAVSKPPSAETVSKGQAPAASVSARPVVATARLCQEFSTGGPGDWSCVPVSAPVAAGPLVFYTRLKSPIDTTVEHRWYRGDELRQTRRLSIETNTDTGYRTYSRYPVDGTGDWKVELRSRDGSLLHEERFTVR